MLIILATFPCSSPGESMLCEKLVAKIASWDFVGKASIAVKVVASFWRFKYFLSVGKSSEIGIVKRIDVHSHSPPVHRDSLRMGHKAEIESRGIVCACGSKVIRVVVIYQSHFFDGIGCVVELAQNVEYFGCNLAIQDHFSHESFTLYIAVKYPQIA